MDLHLILIPPHGVVALDLTEDGSDLIADEGPDDGVLHGAP